MYLKMKSTYASPLKIVHQHDISDFPTEEAKNLLAEKYAVEPTKAELEAWRAKQQKKSERKANDE